MHLSFSASKINLKECQKLLPILMLVSITLVQKVNVFKKRRAILIPLGVFTHLISTSWTIPMNCVLITIIIYILPEISL